MYLKALATSVWDDLRDKLAIFYDRTAELTLPGEETPSALQKREISQTDLQINEHGQLMPSGVPIAPPVGYNPQPSLRETIRAMVQSEKLAQEARDAGFETFDEANDFGDDDDDEPLTRHELAALEGELPSDVLDDPRVKAVLDKYKQKAAGEGETKVSSESAQPGQQAKAPDSEAAKPAK